MGMLQEGRQGEGLDGLCHLLDTLGWASDVGSAADAAATWIRTTIGPDAAVTLAQPDAAGRLRVVWRVGERLDAGRKRSARRRAVLETMRPAQVGSVGPERRTLGIFPLICRSEPVGVLEVLASAETLGSAWDALEVVASQLAITLSNIADRAHLHREVETLRRASVLGTDLVRAGTPEAAVGVAIRFVSERFHVPVAGWWLDGDDRMHLATVRGLGTRRRRELRKELRRMSAWTSLTPPDRQGIRERFARVIEAKQVTVLDIGDAVLFAGNLRQPLEASFEVVGALLAEVLRLLGTASRAKQRNDQLDMGLAWTMHELRGPLLGLRAVLELLLRRDADPLELAVLQGSLREVDRLVGTAEGLLTWAVGARPLRRRRTDLVQVVEEAVESCRLETGEDRVLVLAPPTAYAYIGAGHLRVAVVNLVRNALAFADPGTKVEVALEAGGDYLTLSVRDEGPAIPAGERRAIFDPFTRGRVSGRARNGSGLGLFIARRVVEAHGGRIWVDSDREGTTFHVLLPVTGRREQRSAS